MGNPVLEKEFSFSNQNASAPTFYFVDFSSFYRKRSVIFGYNDLFKRKILPEYFVLPTLQE